MKYVIPEIKTQGKKTFMYNGVKLWNSLPDSIKLIEVNDNFKKKCKKHVFSLMKKNKDSMWIDPSYLVLKFWQNFSLKN